MRAAEHLENASPILKAKAIAALALAKKQEALKIAKGAVYVEVIINGTQCKVLRKNN